MKDPREERLEKFLSITGASRETAIEAFKYIAEQGLYDAQDSDPVKMARTLLFANKWKEYAAQGLPANVIHTMAYVDAKEQIDAKTAPMGMDDYFPTNGGFEGRQAPAPAPKIDQPPATHNESPVVVSPDDRGSVHFNGHTYSVTIRIGGTANMVLALLQEWDKVWSLPGVKSSNGKLEPGAVGEIEIDEISFTTKRWDNETKLYAELWREGKQFATDSSAKEQDIALAAAAAGLTGKAGESSKGRYKLFYQLGNLKPPKKDGTERTGTAPWDYYWNWQRIEQVS